MAIPSTISPDHRPTRKGEHAGLHGILVLLNQNVLVFVVPALLPRARHSVYLFDTSLRATTSHGDVPPSNNRTTNTSHANCRRSVQQNPRDRTCKNREYKSCKMIVSGFALHLYALHSCFPWTGTLVFLSEKKRRVARRKLRLLINAAPCATLHNALR